MKLKTLLTIIGAILSGIVAALLLILGKKPQPPIPAVSITDKAADDIQAIQDKPAAEIYKDDVTPAQKEKVEEIIQNQVNTAMAGAEKYKRKKKTP